MKKYFKSKWTWLFLVIILLATILFLPKCNVNVFNRNSVDPNNTDQSFLVIPQNATFISAFNLGTILHEIEFEKIKYSKTYIEKLEQFYHQNQPFTLVFSDPASAGVSMSKKAVFMIDVGKKAPDVYSASILSLDNQEAFSQMMAKTDSRKYEETNHYKYAKVDIRSSVAWNDQHAIFITSDPTFNKKKVLDQCFDSSSKKYAIKSADFSQFMSQSTSDISFWIDLGSYSQNQLHATDVRGEISRDLLENNYLYGNLEFQEGAIDLDFRFKLDNKIESLLKNVFAPNNEQDIAKYIPQKTPSFLANISLNINGLLNFLLRDSETKVQARNSLIEYGLLLEDFTDAFTGDVLFASYPVENSSKNSVLFGAKIKDQQHFNNLLKVWEDIKKIENEGNGMYKVYTGTVAFFPFETTYPDHLQRLLIKDDYAFISLDKNMIDAVISSLGSNNQAFNYFLPTYNKDSFLTAFGNNEFNAIGQIADQFSVKNYKLRFDGTQLNIHLSLQDEDKPALKQLLALK